MYTSIYVFVYVYIYRDSIYLKRPKILISDLEMQLLKTCLKEIVMICMGSLA